MRQCCAVSVTCWYLVTLPALLKNHRWPSYGNLNGFPDALVPSIATRTNTLSPSAKNVCGSKRVKFNGASASKKPGTLAAPRRGCSHGTPGVSTSTSHSTFESSLSMIAGTSPRPNASYICWTASRLLIVPPCSYLATDWHGLLLIDPPPKGEREDISITICAPLPGPGYPRSRRRRRCRPPPIGGSSRPRCLGGLRRSCRRGRSACLASYRRIGPPST